MMQPPSMPAGPGAAAQDQEKSAEVTVNTSRVARNAATYFVAQLASVVVPLLTVFVIPRVLGEVGVGQIAVASSVCMTALAFMALGVDSYLTREIGKDPARAEPLLRATLGMRWATLVPYVLVCLVIFRLMGVGATIVWIGAATLVMTGLQLFAEPMRSVLAGWEDARRVSLLDLGVGLYPLLALPFLRFGPLSVAVCGAVTMAATLALRYRWIAPVLCMRPVYAADMWHALARGGAPFLINNALLQLFGFTAVFVLRQSADLATIGVHAQATRIFGTLLLVPTAIGYALLPSLARIASLNPAEFRALQSRVLGLLVILGLPVTVSVIALAHPLCRIVFGSGRFEALPLTLQVYALAIIPVYVVSTMYQFLVAQNRNALWALFLLFTLLLYGALSAVLAPYTARLLHNGAVGVVAATVLSELCGAVFALALLGTDLRAESLPMRVGGASLAALGMAGVMWLTRGLFLLIPLALGTAVFLAFAWRLHVLLPEEQAKLKELARRRLLRSG